MIFITDVLSVGRNEGKCNIIHSIFLLPLPNHNTMPISPTFLFFDFLLLSFPSISPFLLPPPSPPPPFPSFLSLSSTLKSEDWSSRKNPDVWWGRHPVIFREAFPPSESSWASFDDIRQLASDEDAEVRLVRCLPTSSSSLSYDVSFGPFDPSSIDSLGSSSLPYSLLVNDVDRFIPSLADWMNEHFKFVPNWRRDDGQVSLSSDGAGIGEGREGKGRKK